MAEAGFSIALPTLDDDDEEEELFSYPAPRFGHPQGAGSSSGSSFGHPSPYTSQHTRGISSASSDAYGSGQRDGLPTSTSTGESSFSFPQQRSTSQASGAYNTQRSNTSNGQQQSSKGGSIGSSTAGPPQVVKKGSFVSLKSAFSKAGGAGPLGSSHHQLDRTQSAGNQQPVPPLPDSGHAYPALRNPFSRVGSNNSLASHSGPPSSFSSPPNHQGQARRRGGPPSSAGRPSISSSSYNQSQSYQHSSRPSQYSVSSSAGGGAPWTRSTTASPPPMPNQLRSRAGFPTTSSQRHMHSLSIMSTGDFANSSATKLPHPTTPSQFALHCLITHFNEKASKHLSVIVSATAYPLSSPLPLLPTIIGPGVDTELDGVLDSLGMVAASGGGTQRPAPGGGTQGGEAMLVVESLKRWRTQAIEDEVGRGAVKSHLSGPSGANVMDAAAMLNERISLSATYIFLRALLSVIRHTPSSSVLGEALGSRIEDLCWRWVTKERDMESLSRYPNRMANRNLLVELLGSLASIRFLTVTDRFLTELKEGAAAGIGNGTSGASSKADREAEGRLDMVIRGMKSFKLKVYPPEAFDMGAEFLKDLATYFAQTHGTVLKTAYVEMLTGLIHPIAETATAEVNHPEWAQAISVIRMQAGKMAAKDKYWQTGYPLVVTCLCVSPREVFMEQWQTCLAQGLAKLKDKHARPIVANTIMRLLWVYLNRCSGESNATLTKTLDSVLRMCFPHRQRVVLPADQPLDVSVCIVHFLLVRQFEYGQELILQFLAEDRLGEGGKAASGGEDVLAPERMTIAVRAILLTLRSMEKDVRTPAFPSTSDFTSCDYGDDYESSGETLPDSFMLKPGMTDFFDRVGPLIGAIALLVDRDVGHLSVFDDRFLAPRSFRTPSDPASGRSIDLSAEPHLHVQHGQLVVAFKASLKPLFELLRAVFDSWPRCLHFSIGINKTLEILCRGTAHVDPDVAKSATAALKRIGATKGKAESVAVGFSRFLTGTDKVFKEGQVGSKPYENQIERLGQVWVDLLGLWLAELEASPADARIAVTVEILAEIEASALFLVSSISRAIRGLGISALRRIASIQALSLPTDETTQRVIRILETEGARKDMVASIPDAALSTAERLRLEAFASSPPADVLLKWCEGDSSTDQNLWHLYYPALITRLLDAVPTTIQIFKILIGRVFLNWQHTILTLNGIGKPPSGTFAGKIPPPLPPRTASDHHLAEQWRILVTVLCATTTVVGDGPSSPSSELPPSRPGLGHLKDIDAERLSTSKVLFQKIISFLMSEHARFRDAVVTALGHISQPIFWPLLESLQSITRHLQDDFRTRSKAATSFKQREGAHLRLYTAVAHVYMRISPLFKDPRSLADISILKAMLQFVRETHSLLAEPGVKDDWELHRLRRYFSVTVENVADGLASVERSDRLPAELRAGVFKTCDDWCSLGRRSDIAAARESRSLRAAVDSYGNGGKDQGQMLSSISQETRLLSTTAANAMAALCQGSIFLDQLPSPQGNGTVSGVDLISVLHWIRGLFASPVTHSHEVGRKALSSLLAFNSQRRVLLEEVLLQSCAEGDQFDVRRSFFSIVVDAVLGPRPPIMSFAQKAFLTLMKLGHPDVGIRRKAFQLLEHVLADDIQQLAHFQPAVGSSAPSIFLRAQRQIAVLLADRFPQNASEVLSECTLRLSQIEAIRRPIILAICPAFLTHIDLNRAPLEDATVPASPFSAQLALSNLLFIAVRFGESHPTEMQDIWISLACGPFPQNCNSIIKFLIQQCSRRSSLEFVLHAKRVIASLAESPIGSAVFEDLCGFIEPAAMVQSPVVEDPRSPPATGGASFIPDLDALFPLPTKSQALSTGQLALLFVGEMMLERAREPSLDGKLSVLLHATLTQVDHPTSLVREQAQTLLFQILWAWTCESGDVEEGSDWTSLRQSISDMWDTKTSLFWPPESASSQGGDLRAPPKMDTLVSQVLDVLEPFHPDLRHVWGALAVDWATSCPNRHLACRSFQLFRVLVPVVTARMLADMLGRLSNTIADPSPENNAFCREILFSFCGIVRSMDSEDLLAYPQLFWCTAACLSTTVEAEFKIVLDLLGLLLDRLDLQEAEVVHVLLENQPRHWHGDELRLQTLLLPGLRSSVTDEATFNLLTRLAKINSHHLIDFQDERTLHVFTACLPWCLHAMDGGPLSENIIDLATDVARIAASERKPSIERIMTSFAKARFRTKDDFLRQAVGCLREHFLAQHAFSVILLLLGFILNDREWIREKTMQVLKLVFQSPDAREPLATFGAELLMPLLRLLKTPFAPQALEVLNEPIVISGGPAAAQVLRMSMALGTVMNSLADNAGEVFGTPEASGWCVAKIEEQSATARKNALAVFETCPDGARVQSMAHFSMQFADTYHNDSQLSLESFAPSMMTEDVTLGQLVGDLHSLNQMFGDEDSDSDDDAPSPYDFSPRNQSRIGNGLTSDTASERRVQNILHRSMARTPSISSIQDFERARLASQPSTSTPPFGPPYSNGTPRTSLSDSGSEDGSHTPGDNRRPSHRDDYYAGRGETNGHSQGPSGDGWGEEEEDGEEEFGLDAGGGMASPPPQQEEGVPERRGLRGLLLGGTPRSSPARP